MHELVHWLGVGPFASEKKEEARTTFVCCFSFLPCCSCCILTLPVQRRLQRHVGSFLVLWFCLGRVGSVWVVLLSLCFESHHGDMSLVSLAS